MTVRPFFIVNPEANNGRALPHWEAVRVHLDSRGIKYDFAFSRDADDVERLAKEAAQSKGTLVVGVGGDGTLSRIASALVGSGAVLGVIPAGTGNDFARSFGIPLERAAACEVLLNGEDVPLDLGRYNGRFFLNVTGAGLDAAVVVDANRLKRFLGSLAYLAALVRQLATYRPCLLQITLDGQQIKEEAWLVSVANGRYYGGGMQVAPQADTGDGLADVIVVGRMPRLKFLYMFPKVYSGRHVLLPSVRVYRAKTVCVEGVRALPVHTDGDLTGHLPFCVTMERHAILLRVPPKNFGTQ
ncbi:MAG: diacylglycerol kinase family lipid kinase [Firmicutes bacterium]|nr:diacylglycerol kinase family lipid kinase [Bacillota bacterium]